jgi:hypothetical protein
MTFRSNLKALLAVGLTAGGAALFSMPAQAGFYGEDFDEGPRVERRVTTTTVEERRVARPAYEDAYEAPAPVYAPRFHYRRPIVARPVFYAQPLRPRPVFVGGYGGGCRVIVKRIENEWGDVVVKKTRICG